MSPRAYSTIRFRGQNIFDVAEGTDSTCPTLAARFLLTCAVNSKEGVDQSIKLLNVTPDCIWVYLSVMPLDCTIMTHKERRAGGINQQLLQGLLTLS